jgi:hypothetical protein
MGSFDVKTANIFFYDKLWQHKSSDLISTRTDFQLTSNKSGSRLLKTSVMATRITYDFKIQSIRRMSSFTAMKLGFFIFKNDKGKPLSLKNSQKCLEAGRQKP